MTKLYDVSMRKMEEACLSAWRSDLLSEAHGDVLEIGSGTGVNLSYYPESIGSLVLAEPEPYMLAILRRKIGERYGGKIRAEGVAANALEFPDSSSDTVVSTLVLCSVNSPEAVLGEIKRVLRPGGKLCFIEHVVAKETPRLLKWQKIFQPFWVHMFGNCHLTRDTEMYISHAGFAFHRIERLNSSGAPPVVSPTIKGVAISV